MSEGASSAPGSRPDAAASLDAASVVVDAGPLRGFALALLQAMGAGQAAASATARHLVRANLSGHDSHGVLRLAQYVAEADRGELAPGAEPQLLRETATTALFDARRGLGQHSTLIAADWVLGRAEEQGLAAAAIRHSMHIGRLGEYAEHLAERGVIAFVTVGQVGLGAATVAPFGGAGRFLGTNPWCIGVPAAGRPPMIFDAATSTIAEGKVRDALARGVSIPAGTLRAPDGTPTTDPAQLYAGGAMTPLGGDLAGHKGFGLSLAAALIGGLAMIGDSAPTSGGTGQPPPPGEPHLAGVFLLAINPSPFGNALDYKERVGAVLGAAEKVPAAPGFAGVVVPGDPERRTRAERERSGIAVPATTWAQLAEIGARFGVELPPRL